MLAAYSLSPLRAQVHSRRSRSPPCSTGRPNKSTSSSRSVHHGAQGRTPWATGRLRGGRQCTMLRQKLEDTLRLVERVAESPTRPRAGRARAARSGGSEGGPRGGRRGGGRGGEKRGRQAAYEENFSELLDSDSGSDSGFPQAGTKKPKVEGAYSHPGTSRGALMALVHGGPPGGGKSKVGSGASLSEHQQLDEEERQQLKELKQMVAVLKKKIPQDVAAAPAPPSAEQLTLGGATQGEAPQTMADRLLLAEVCEHACVLVCLCAC